MYVCMCVSVCGRITHHSEGQGEEGVGVGEDKRYEAIGEDELQPSIIKRNESVELLIVRAIVMISSIFIFIDENRIP